MKNNSEVTAENLKAQLKCVQSDIFSALKRYVKVFSFDPVLKKILSQSYCSINKDKYTLGLDGKRVYGIIDNYSPEKRDAIVTEAKNQLRKNVDNERKVLDMEIIILNYQQAGSFIKNVTLIPALRSHLQNLRCAYIYMLEYEASFAPKSLN